MQAIRCKIIISSPHRKPGFNLGAVLTSIQSNDYRRPGKVSLELGEQRPWIERDPYGHCGLGRKSLHWWDLPTSRLSSYNRLHTLLFTQFFVLFYFYTIHVGYLQRCTEFLLTTEHSSFKGRSVCEAESSFRMTDGICITNKRLVVRASCFQRIYCLLFLYRSVFKGFSFQLGNFSFILELATWIQNSYNNLLILIIILIVLPVLTPFC